MSAWAWVHAAGEGSYHQTWLYSAAKSVRLGKLYVCAETQESPSPKDSSHWRPDCRCMAKVGMRFSMFWLLFLSLFLLLYPGVV